jgi:lipopolysaccharide/colanic/teichoic acid biosynthesis glycosyltransferase
MYVDAMERFPEMYKYDYTPEELKKLYFKIPDDPRLTRFGSRLRKTTLDELPNLINVIKGDMNLVGPRPDIPEMIKYYEQWERKKFTVKPGVTGLAQINGRGLLNFKKTLERDVEYVENRSLWMDIKVLMKTIKVSLLRIGAF